MKYTILLVATVLVLFFGVPDFILYSKDWMRWLPFLLIVFVIPFLLFKITAEWKSQSIWTMVMPFVSVLIVGPLYGMWKENRSEKDLQQNGMFIKGVVTDTWYGTHSRQEKWSFKGEFQVEGKTYQTFGYRNQDDRLIVGDSITVKYSTRNPENCQVILE